MFSLLSVLFYGLLFDSFSGGSSNNRIHFTLLTKYILLKLSGIGKVKNYVPKPTAQGMQSASDIELLPKGKSSLISYQTLLGYPRWENNHKWVKITQRQILIHYFRNSLVEELPHNGVSCLTILILHIH